MFVGPVAGLDVEASGFVVNAALGASARTLMVRVAAADAWPKSS